MLCVLVFWGNKGFSFVPMHFSIANMVMVPYFVIVFC